MFDHDNLLIYFFFFAFCAELFFKIGLLQEDIGDIVAATQQPKKCGGPSSIQCLMLNSTNYNVYSMRWKITLKVHKVWVVIEIDSTDGDKNDMATAL